MSVKKMFCVFLLDLRSTETLVLFQKHIIHKVSVWLLLRGPKNQEEKMFTKICLNLGLYVYIHTQILALYTCICADSYMRTHRDTLNGDNVNPRKI